MLTPENLTEIKAIIQKYHTAMIAEISGVDVLTPEEITILEQSGLLVDGLSAEEAYLYGQAMSSIKAPQFQTMSYSEFKTELAKNPIPLSIPEKRAVTYAQLSSAQYLRGLGNRVDVKTGQVLIEADKKLRAQTEAGVRDRVATNIAKRQTLKQLKSDLGWMAEDWARDWDRIALTEKNTAMQNGVADGIKEQHGEDARVFKRPMPDACKHCQRLHIGPDGAPRIFKMSTLVANGTNVGRKAGQWQAVVGSVHPNCQCQLGHIPAGWGFDEEGAMRPGGAYGKVHDDEAAAEKSLRAEDALQKSLSVVGRVAYRNVTIAVENPAGSVRRWKDRTGRSGETVMRYPYGFIEGTKGADGDEYDAFLGPDPDAELVFVMHIRDVGSDRYDEDKAFIGFSHIHHAKAAFMAHYDDPRMLHSITAVPWGEFVQKVFSTNDGMVKALNSGPRLVLKSNVYTGKGTRTGTPGHYEYDYDEDKQPRHAEHDIGKLPPEVQAEIIEGVNFVTRLFPELKGIRVVIADYDLDHAHATKDNKRIKLNPTTWLDADKMQQQQEDLEGMVIDPSVKGIIIHEFGHILSGRILNAIGSKKYNEIRRKHLGEVSGDKKDPWGGDVFTNLLNTQMPSVYGMENINEYEAESFSSVLLGKTGVHPDSHDSSLKQSKAYWADMIQAYRNAPGLSKSGPRLILKSGPFIGPRGGKWADPEHTIPWKEEIPESHARDTAKEADRKGKHGKEQQDFVYQHIRGEHVKTTVPLHALDTIDPGDQKRVDEYAAREGGSAPAIRVSYGERSAKRGGDKLYVADGNHRVAAAKKRGDSHIEVMLPKEDHTRWERKQSETTGSQTKGAAKEAYHAVSRDEAHRAVLNKLSQKDIFGWTRSEGRGYKERIAHTIAANPEVRNATLNIFHQQYQGHTGKKIPLDEFLDTPITLYRAGKVPGDEHFSSYTYDKKIAEGFAEKYGEAVHESKVKPRDTYGMINEMAEGEILVPLFSEASKELKVGTTVHVKGKAFNILKRVGKNITLQPASGGKEFTYHESKILSLIKKSFALSKSGPYIGPRGGKWADPQHKIPWGEQTHQGQRTLGVSETAVREVVDNAWDRGVLTGKITSNRHGFTKISPGFVIGHQMTLKRPDGKMVNVPIRINASERENRGSGSFHTATIDGKEAPSLLSVTVPTSGDEDGIKRVLREILAHELSHGLDPVTKQSSKKHATSAQGATAYYNAPREVVAYRHEIFRELNTPQVAAATKEHAELWADDNDTPRASSWGVEDALRYSETWKRIEGHLSPANRRKMYQTAAAAVTAHVAGESSPMEKALSKSGPFIGPRGGKWKDAQHTIPWEEEKIKNVSISSAVLDAYGEQLMALAQAKMDGKVVGELHYNVSEGVPSIDRVEVNVKRAGIGSKLVAELAKEYGYKNIKWDMMTESGYALRNALDRKYGFDRDAATPKKIDAKAFGQKYGKVLHTEPLSAHQQNVYIELTSQGKLDALTKEVDRLGGALVNTQEHEGTFWADVDLPTLSKAGPYIGPRGGKWKDPKHTIPWKEEEPGGVHKILQNFVGKYGGKVSPHRTDPTKLAVKVPHANAKALATLKAQFNLPASIFMGGKYAILEIQKHKIAAKKPKPKPVKTHEDLPFTVAGTPSAPAQTNSPPYSAGEWQPHKSVAEAKSWAKQRGVDVAYKDLATANATNEALSECHPYVLRHVSFVGSAKDLKQWAKDNPIENKEAMTSAKQKRDLRQFSLGGSAIAIAHPYTKKPYTKSVVVLHDSWSTDAKYKKLKSPSVGGFTLGRELKDTLRHEFGHVEAFVMRHMYPKGSTRSCWELWKGEAIKQLKTRSKDVMKEVSEYGATNPHELWAEMSVLRRTKYKPVPKWAKDVVQKMGIDHTDWKSMGDPWSKKS